MRKIMACLDVGSDTIKCVVGEMVKRKLNILAVAESPSKGVKYGIVEDPNSLLDPLRSVIQNQSLSAPCNIGFHSLMTKPFLWVITVILEVNSYLLLKIM